MKLPLNTLLIALALGLALGQASPATAADAGATSAALPGDSLYHLQAGFTDLHGQSLQWAALQGRPQLVSMFYGNCSLMCPLILENAKAVQKQLSPEQRARLGVAMITLDPARDAPAALAEVAERNRTPADWQYLQPDADDVRAVASVLDVRYRFRDDGSINHTSALVLLDAHGQILARSEVSSAIPDPVFIDSVRKALASN